MLEMLRGVAGGRLRPLLRHGAWIFVGLTILLVLAIRVRLLPMPLERDEGEYAYAGQLILHGIPPYREAYNMKLPGTYAAYAVIMAIFGQTPSSIHFGLALVNAASIVLMFLLGRTLLDEVTGIVAAAVFALLSLSPTILGLAGHATHFVVLPALAGMYLLARSQWSVASSLKSGASRPNSDLRTTDHKLRFLAGLLLGIAFVMKQHGIFFGIFGGLYLLWCGVGDFVEARAAHKAPRARRSSRIPVRRPVRSGFSQGGSLGEGGTNHASQSTFTPTKALAKAESFTIDAPRPGDYALLLLTFVAGFVVPYGLTCLIMWLAGVFPQFWFWTVAYAAKYAGARQIVYGSDFLRSALTVVVGPNLLLWLLPWTGALVMWWDERLEIRQRFFIAALLVFSFTSVSVGFYYRPHYFILLLPALALLAGVAVSRSLRVLRRDKTLELFLAVPILGLFAFGGLAVLIGNGSMLFADAPDKVVQQLYQSTLNFQSAKAANYLKAQAPKDARVAVIGSEPQIYFGADRRSATGFIYMYPLMEPQSYAAKMQEDMIAEIERARPEYAVYVNDDFSWRRESDSLPKLDNWWKEYWPANYELMTSYDIEESRGESATLAPAANADGQPKRLLVLKRRH